MGRLAGIWQEEGRPFKGTKVEVLGARKGSPLECALKGGIWEREKGTGGQPGAGSAEVRPGPLVPTGPLQVGTSRSRGDILLCHAHRRATHKSGLPFL